MKSRKVVSLTARRIFKPVPKSKLRARLAPKKEAA